MLKHKYKIVGSLIAVNTILAGIALYQQNLLGLVCLASVVYCVCCYRSMKRTEKELQKLIDAFQGPL